MVNFRTFEKDGIKIGIEEQINSRRKKRRG